MTIKELFDFVTDITINEDNIDHYLEQAMTLTSTRSHDDVTEQQKIDEQVNFFVQALVLIIGNIKMQICFSLKYSVILKFRVNI